MEVLVIDIGGTNIKYALATRDGQLSFKGSMPTQAFKGAELLFEKVGQIVLEIQQKKIDGIAISTAGQVDAQSGVIVHATDAIPGYTGFLLKERLEKNFKLPVSVENDVHCAALGELWKGNVPTHDFLALTIGTGIGGAVVINGEIYHGATYSAGEIGHMTLIYNGLPCNCGHKGCYERYGSAQALDLMISEFIGDISTQTFEQAKKGQPEYLHVLNQWVDYFTEGLKGLVHIFNPSCILIGGGMTAQGEFLERLIRNKLDEKIMNSFSKKLTLKLMTLGNDANLLGALYWFLESEGIRNDLHTL